MADEGAHNMQGRAGKEEEGLPPQAEGGEKGDAPFSQTLKEERGLRQRRRRWRAPG